MGQRAWWLLAIGCVLAVPRMSAAVCGPSIGGALAANAIGADHDPGRAADGKASAPKLLTSQARADACLEMAETCLSKKDYLAAREACARVRAATTDAGRIAQAQMLLARSHLQQRNYPVARQEFLRLLEMAGLDRQLRWEAEALLGAIDLLPRLRTDHPRLFFSAETWAAVRRRALTAEKPLFDRLKARVDRVALEDIRSGDWAMSESGGVMEAAFVYRVTGDPAALDKVRRMLRATVDIFPEGRGHGERAYPSIAWVAALDWVWNDLAPPEREALADAMLGYAWKRLAQIKTPGGRSWLGIWPHYYAGSMFAFAGIVLLEPAADDVAYARALSLLGIGFKQYQERFASLIRTSGDDGVWQTNVEYDLAEVPNAVFAFLHAWQPATGTELPRDWSIVGVSPHVALRMAVGMGTNHFKHFNYAGHSNGAWGFGQVHSNALYDHLGHFMHFFGQSHAQEAAIAHFLRCRMVETGAGPSDGVYPVFRFLMTDLEKAPPPELPQGLPVARHFDSVGLVLMSSGFAPGDTYVLYSQGGGVLGRRHDFDATHFSIYKKGFLALDTGARFALPHSPNYRHQTVAHNCVLIHMPGERFPPSATGPVVANTAGQNKWPQEARPLAFETDRLYAYTATDATRVYHPDKCARMVRQFLYLPPDHFLVFDRVTSTRAEYAKTWLLHTANEPAMAGKEFRADQDQGRIFCRTLYPRDALLEKVGGPGKEFWADGRNWAIVDRFQAPGAGDWWKQYGRGSTEPPEAMGRWRVEVKPGEARTDDLFLHLIQASDQTVTKMVDSQVSETARQIRCRFSAGSRDYTIDLNKTDDVGGHIRIAETGKAIVDRDLAGGIVPQAGLALVNEKAVMPVQTAVVAQGTVPVSGSTKTGPAPLTSAPSQVTSKAERSVQSLIRQIAEPKAQVILDQDVRSVAAVELVGIGKPAVEPLIGALANPEAEVRRRAAWVLGEIKDGRAATALAKALHDEDGFVRIAAGEALGKIGPPAVDVLIAALNHREPAVRITAARALGTIADPRAVERLARDCADLRVNENETVSLDTGTVLAWALGRIRDVRGVPALMTALRSQDPRMREYAAWALGETGKAAVGPLIAALGEENAEARDGAVRALGAIGKPAVAPLMGALQDPNPSVRAHAAGALGMTGAPESETAILALLKDQSNLVRSRAARALGKVAGPRSVEPLQIALRDADPEVRRSAAEGLGEAKDPRAAELLMACLKDEDPRVRRAAFDALGELQDRRAVAPAIAALKDPDRLVRLSAAEVLGRIKDSRAIEPLIEAVGDAYHAVGYEANDALHTITGHKLDIPVGWNAQTLRTYRLPLWRRWWEENKGKFDK